MKKALFPFSFILFFLILTPLFKIQGKTLPLHPTPPAVESLSSDLTDLGSYQKRLDEIRQDQVTLQNRIVEGQNNLKNESEKAKSFLEIEEITPEEFKPYLNQWRLMDDSYRDVLRDLENPIEEVGQIQIRLNSKLKLFQLKVGDIQLLLNKLSPGEKKIELSDSLAHFKNLIRLYEAENDKIEKILAQLGKNKTAMTLSFQLCEKNLRLLEQKWESIRFSRFKMRQQPKFSSETFLLANHEFRFRIENYRSSFDSIKDYFWQLAEIIHQRAAQDLMVLLSVLVIGFILFWLRKIANRMELNSESSILEKFGRRFFVSFSANIISFLPFLIFGVVLLIFSEARQPIGIFIFFSTLFAYLLFLIVHSIQILLKSYRSYPPLLSISPPIANSLNRYSILLFSFIYLLILTSLLGSILEYESEARRLLKWSLEIFIFGILFVSVRSGRILSLTHHPERWIPRFLRFILRFSILLILISIIGLDGIGYTYLSDYLADASLKTLAIIPLILFLKKGLDELINHNFFEKGFSRFKINFQLLSKWKKTLHHWITLGLWTLFVFWIASIWDVTPEFLDFLRKVLALGVRVGNVHLTLGLILSVFLTLYLSVVVSRLIRAILERNFYKRPQWDIGIQHAISTGIHYLIVLFGILIALHLLGFDIQNITVLAGALGVGLGFGLQNLANNFASGIVLLIERPVKVGDLIQVNDLIGRVKQIGARSTTVETIDRSSILIPNGELVSSHVVNWTYGDSTAGLAIPLGVSYQSDLQKVKGLLLKVAETNEEILKDPPARVEFKGFGESSIDLILRVWVDDIEDRRDVQTALFFEIEKVFRENKIEIPYPHREIFVHNS